MRRLIRWMGQAMPLSKARDAERKRLERKASRLAHFALAERREMGRTRLDKQLLSSAGSKAVQPIEINNDSDWILANNTFTDIDADGNVIPEM